MESALILQNAIVLHTRPYQNSSMLVDFLTENDGIIRCVAKGARAKRKSHNILQFCHYQLTYSGRSDLKTLKILEATKVYHLEKKALFCGFYLNELTLRLLHSYDPYPKVFELLCSAMAALDSGLDHNAINNTVDNTNELDIEIILRRFELCLLNEIGYLMDMNVDCLNGQALVEDLNYYMITDQGFTSVDLEPERNASSEKRFTILGSTLKSLSQLLLVDSFEEIDDEEQNLNWSALSIQARKEAKILCRLMLSPLLGDKPLESRRLFEKFKS